MGTVGNEPHTNFGRTRVQEKSRVIWGRCAAPPQSST